MSRAWKHLLRVLMEFPCAADSSRCAPLAEAAPEKPVADLVVHSSEPDVLPRYPAEAWRHGELPTEVAPRQARRRLPLPD